MPSSSPFRLVFPLLICGLSVFAEAGVREKAVISLTFDGKATPEGQPDLTDGAVAGKAQDHASLPQGGTATASAFVGSADGRSLLLDPSARQVLVLTGTGDAAQSKALTVSGFFASLHLLTNNAMHGLLARRQPGNAGKSNYGVNFNPATDAFQLYVNDGSGFKVAVYSVRSTIGSRRPTHLAASFETGDAPGADSDSDPDDVRVRLFVNGAPVTAVSVTNGFAEATSAWLQDVRLENCVSDTPLVIGGSYADGELTRLICDDILLFASALSDEEAKSLFEEVAGDSAETLRRQLSDDLSGKPAPVIGRLSQYGLTVGQSARLVITGNYLAGARLQPGLHGVTAVAVEGNEPRRAAFDVAVPKDTVPGRYVFRVITDRGISKPVVVSIDGLPQYTEDKFPEATPASELPLAVSGMISGTEQKRIYFRGTSGQRVVAEVEARRIASRLDPVIEIKTALSAPLAIQWQQPDLSGDARAVVTLPADGLYYAELHDLQYRAPANSPWRLLLGDLPASSLAWPPALASGSSSVRTLGRAGVSEPVTVRAAGGAPAIESGTSILPLPTFLSGSGREVTEPLEGTFDAAPIDAVFTAAPFVPVFVNGRIGVSNETDQFLLTVTPGQTLHFSVAARSLSSPLRAELSVFRGEERVAFSDGDSGASDPALDYTVPEGATQLRVQLRDLTGRGSPAALYRLLVSRRDRPGFLLQTSMDTLKLPVNGSAPLKLSVIRQSPAFRYTGAIRLQASGVPGLAIVPQVLPASDQNQQVLVVLTRTQPASAAANGGQIAPSLSIRGETEGLEVNVSADLEVLLDSLPANRLTFPEHDVVAGSDTAIPAIVTLDSVPPMLLRGIPATLNVRVLPLAPISTDFVRFEMVTTEVPRRTDPQKPNSPMKPVISLADLPFGPARQQVFPLEIEVPLDVVENTVDALIGAEFVDQPLASAETAKAWTAPLRLTVDHAVVLKAPADATKATKGKAVMVSGVIQRHPQFTEAVSVVAGGLPAGYSSAPAAVAADQSTFSLSIGVPEDAAAGAIPNMTLTVQRLSGTPVTPPVPLKITVE